MRQPRVIDWLRKHYPQYSPWVYDPMGFRWLSVSDRTIEVHGESHGYDESSGTHLVTYVIVKTMEDGTPNRTELDIVPKLEYCG